MLDQLVLARALQRGERQQHGVVAQRPRRARLLDRLRRLADRAGDHDQRPVGPFARRLDRELEHRPVEPDLADGELRRVHADRQAARAGVDVVAADGALRLLVEFPVGIERQRMRRDHRALAQTATGPAPAGRANASALSMVMRVILTQFRPGEGEDVAGIVQSASPSRGSSACSRAARPRPALPARP